MIRGEPKITFLFPYRWLTEEEGKQYLPQNLYYQIKRQVGEEGMDIIKSVTNYSVEIAYQYREPIKFPLTKPQIEKYLKAIFPHARCFDFEVSFTQLNSRTQLPLCDWRMYFNVSS